jgi:hypothetical protein
LRSAFAIGKSRSTRWRSIPQPSTCISCTHSCFPQLRVVDGELWNRMKARPPTVRRDSKAHGQASIQSVPSAEVLVLRRDRMQRAWWRLHHALARKIGRLQCALTRHFHESTDHQPPGGGKASPPGPAQHTRVRIFSRSLAASIRARSTVWG